MPASASVIRKQKSCKVGEEYQNTGTEGLEFSLSGEPAMSLGAATMERFSFASRVFRYVKRPPAAWTRTRRRDNLRRDSVDNTTSHGGTPWNSSIGSRRRRSPNGSAFPRGATR